jgi:hypothetical protein
MDMRRFAPFFEQKRSEIRSQRQKIEFVLAKGPSTVKTIADKTELATDLVVWNLMGLLRWGKIEVAGEEEHELIYKLKEI